MNYWAALALARYADLVQNREKDYKFSYEKMISPTGNTAIYLLNAYARLQQVNAQPLVQALDAAALAKARKEMEVCVDVDPETGKNLTEQEWKLAQLVVSFPEVIEKAMDELLPSGLCTCVSHVWCVSKPGRNAEFPLHATGTLSWFWLPVVILVTSPHPRTACPSAAKSKPALSKPYANPRHGATATATRSVHLDEWVSTVVFILMNGCVCTGAPAWFRYLYEMASSVHKFYDCDDCRVVFQKEGKVAVRLLLLIEAVRHTMKTCFDLVGIRVIDKM